MFTNLQAVVLAAGKSSRLKTGKSKLLEPICGQEMILYPVRLLAQIAIPTTVVVGFEKEAVQKKIERQLSSITFVEQTEQLGTGHAILCSKALWNKDHILIMNGDMPLVSADILRKLYDKHIQKDAAISFVVAHHCDPTEVSYGRVVKSAESIKIIEAKELNDLSEYCSLNAGIYIAKKSFLEENITQLQKHSLVGEWYITDLIALASDKNMGVETVTAPFDYIRGINTFKELWAAEQIKKSEIIQHWMAEGVRFSSPHTTHIDNDVIIESGTFIGAGTHLLSKTKIGKNCIVSPYSIITNSIVQDDVTIHSHSVVNEAVLKDQVSVGPFAHIKKTTLEKDSVIGNFVETTRSTVGSESKIKHLAYIGDSSIGERVNIGAGTITCNYDGTLKHKTIIENEVFVGSNATLIAPLTIEKKAFIAAGSTITHNVPQEALAIARQRQTNKDGYARTLREQESNTTEKQPFFAALKSSDFDGEQQA